MDEQSKMLLEQQGVGTLIPELETLGVEVLAIRSTLCVLRYHESEYQVQFADLGAFVFQLHATTIDHLRGRGEGEAPFFEAVGKQMSGEKVWAYFHAKCLQDYAWVLFPQGCHVDREIPYSEAQDGAYCCDYCDVPLLESPDIACGCVSSPAYQSECAVGNLLLLRMKGAANRAQGNRTGLTDAEYDHLLNGFMEAEYAYVCHCNNGMYLEAGDKERK